MKPVLGEEMLYHELNADRTQINKIKAKRRRSLTLKLIMIVIVGLLVITIMVIITTTIKIRKENSGKIPGFEDRDRKIVETQNG